MTWSTYAVIPAALLCMTANAVLPWVHHECPHHLGMADAGAATHGAPRAENVPGQHPPSETHAHAHGDTHGAPTVLSVPCHGHAEQNHTDVPCICGYYTQVLGDVPVLLALPSPAPHLVGVLPRETYRPRAKRSRPRCVHSPYFLPLSQAPPA